MAATFNPPTNYTNSSLATNLLLAVPRFAKRAGAFAIHYIPDHVDSIINKLLTGGSVIADPTTNLSTPSSTATNSSSLLNLLTPLASTAEPVISAAAATGASPEGSLSMFSLSNLKTLTSFGSYVISKWALTTFLVAVALNRTQVYASARVPLRMHYLLRAALYCVPIAMLLVQIQTVLRALRCQSSPDWSIMRYNNESANYMLDHAGNGGFLYDLGKSALFWESDEQSCQAVGMAALPAGQSHFGSLSLLWPLFLSFCVGNLVETLVAALSGRQPITENSLFEQSLAFAEAEALVVKPFEFALLTGTPDVDAGLPLKVKNIKRIMNVTPEMLLISLISALSNLSSNILAVFGKRKKWRLVNTAVWGFAYMGAFLWGIYKVLTEEDYQAWSFRFPTVFIVGFIPHLLIITGMLGCAIIYSLALLVMMLSPPPGQNPRTLKERFALAYENLQANVYLATGENIRFSWEDDFYSSLLKAGFTILSCASEAVYLNESTNVRVAGLTWLEKTRIEELSKRTGVLFKKTQDSIPDEIRRRAAMGYSSVDQADQGLSAHSSGYAIERKPKTRDRNADPLVMNSSGNMGIVERHGRLPLALRFMRGLFWLSLGVTLNSFFMLCRLVGINYRPAWARRLVGPNTPEKPRNEPAKKSKTIDFWYLTDDGQFRQASDPKVDVEAEMRKQQALGRLRVPLTGGEREMDDRLYDWWRLGGWFGEADSSGEFRPRVDIDDDATSVISVSTTDGTSNEWTTDGESEGQTTPTHSNPYPEHASSRPQNDLIDPDILAGLLDPQSVEKQNEARMLARRLRTPGVLTRSAYGQQTARSRAAVLTSSRSFNPERRILDAQEEERRLETFILEQRSKLPEHAQLGGSSLNTDWSTGAAGMGSGGPLCVVCQDEPRTVLLWPCGCLGLCDECRVIMATRNFTNCVCCRTPTEAFSRLYVP